MEVILKAVVTGFILSIMIGPVFFLLMETSIKKGIRAALMFDVGVILSDLIYIGIAYMFYSEVQKVTEGTQGDWLKLIGGIVFLGYGTFTFFKKVTDMEFDAEGKVITNKGDYRNLMLKGFVLNFANPTVIFYWFTVMTLAEKSTYNNSAPLFFFLGIILATFFCFDLLKVIGAKKLRPLVTTSILKSLNQLIGIVFLGFGLYLTIRGVILLQH